jgi:ClpP class serine protease
MANGINILSPLSPRQKEVLMEGVDKIYTTFTEHVAKGRNLSIDRVKDIAKGRIWSGSQAVENGLADHIGGITEAIAMAADMADITDNFVIYELAPEPTQIEEFLNTVTGLFTQSWGVNPAIYGEDIKKLLTENMYLFNNHGIQCVMPGNIRLNL